MQESYKRVKQLAELNNMSITELQKVLGLGKTSLYKWNYEDKIPKIDKFIKIADYFNVSVDYLLCRTDRPEMQTPVYKPSTYRIVDRLETMSLEDKDLEAILGLIKVLKDYIQK